MRLFLAGYETCHDGHGYIAPDHASVFLSYFYRKQTEKALARHRQIGSRPSMMVIDSGAHTFFNQVGISVTGGKSTGKAQDPEEYFGRYLEWADIWKDTFDYFVDLDLQQIVGRPKVAEWRKRIIDRGLGEKCIPVFHAMEPFSEWERMVNEWPSRYIGIEGLRAHTNGILPYNKFLRYAYENGCRVHGFAFTRQSLCERFPFYSVDSSSWTASYRYGRYYVWDGRRLRNVDSNARSTRLVGLPPSLWSDKRTPEATLEKMTRSAEEFLSMGRFVTDLWERRGIDWSQHEPTLR